MSAGMDWKESKYVIAQCTNSNTERYCAFGIH